MENTRFTLNFDVSFNSNAFVFVLPLTSVNFIFPEAVKHSINPGCARSLSSDGVTGKYPSHTPTDGLNSWAKAAINSEVVLYAIPSISAMVNIIPESALSFKFSVNIILPIMRLSVRINTGQGIENISVPLLMITFSANRVNVIGILQVLNCCFL